MKRLRLSIDLTQEQSDFLTKLPFGWRQQIYSALTDMIIDMTKNHGTKSLSYIISQRINLNDYFSSED